jgi:adenylate kinase
MRFRVTLVDPHSRFSGQKQGFLKRFEVDGDCAVDIRRGYEAQHPRLDVLVDEIEPDIIVSAETKGNEIVFTRASAE